MAFSFELGDIFIGNFPQSQAFGINPQNYAKFGLKGHNGLDFACPAGTQIVATADGKVLEVASDSTGYGNYVKLKHNGFVSLYGHLDHQSVNVGDEVICGQLIGISDNTGNSTGPHLHFGVAPCDSNGIKTEKDNGYAGYIDPNGSRCHWTIKNLTSPIKQTTTIDTLPVAKKDFENLVRKSTAYDGICDYLKLDKSSTESSKLISAFNDLESKLQESIKSLDRVEAELTTCLNQTPVSNSQNNPELIPDAGSNSGDTGTVEDNPDVPSRGTNNPANGIDIGGFTFSQISQAVGKVSNWFKTFFHNIVKFFVRW
jgi:murein DD-endopeptidase MepM/ murein hydrolase activator NlpD